MHVVLLIAETWYIATANVELVEMRSSISPYSHTAGEVNRNGDIHLITSKPNLSPSHPHNTDCTLPGMGVKYQQSPPGRCNSPNPHHTRDYPH